MRRFRHQTPTPDPGDDLSWPNLIISQRRQISPGETLDVELLNVPDTAKGEPYSVTLELLDENGKVLFRSLQFISNLNLASHGSGNRFEFFH